MDDNSDEVLLAPIVYVIIAKSFSRGGYIIQTVKL